MKDKIAAIKSRYDLPSLIPSLGISIELGVAEGGFSEAILARGKTSYHYGVDRYTGERGHTDDEYLKALHRLEKFKHRFTLLRCDFSVAVKLFPDEYFDFIYVDGYAHTGQERGKTFYDWWPKVKPGGLFGGDDYDVQWPETTIAVNTFVKNVNRELYVTQCDKGEDWASLFQSWFVQK